MKALASDKETVFLDGPGFFGKLLLFLFCIVCFSPIHYLLSSTLPEKIVFYYQGFIVLSCLYFFFDIFFRKDVHFSIAHKEVVLNYGFIFPLTRKKIPISKEATLLVTTKCLDSVEEAIKRDVNIKDRRNYRIRNDSTMVKSFFLQNNEHENFHLLDRIYDKDNKQRISELLALEKQLSEIIIICRSTTAS